MDRAIETAANGNTNILDLILNNSHFECFDTIYINQAFFNAAFNNQPDACEMLLNSCLIKSSILRKGLEATNDLRIKHTLNYHLLHNRSCSVGYEPPRKKRKIVEASYKLQNTDANTQVITKLSDNFQYLQTNSKKNIDDINYQGKELYKPDDQPYNSSYSAYQNMAHSMSSLYANNNIGYGSTTDLHHGIEFSNKVNAAFI